MQLHGFEIFTLPGTDLDGCSEDAVMDSKSHCYLGLEDLSVDASSLKVAPND